MDTEKKIFLNMVTGMSKNFHEFLNDLENQDMQITDKELVEYLQKIDAILQKLFFRWNNNIKAESLEDTKTQKKRNICPDASLKDNQAEDTSKRMKPENNYGPVKVDVLLHKINATIKNEVGSDTSDSEDELNKEEKNYNTVSSSHNDSNVGEKKRTRLSPERENYFDIHIKTIAKDVYSCLICNIPSLSTANVKTHVKGKSHQKQISASSSKRESSLNRIDSNALNLFLGSVDQDLVTDRDGLKYVTMAQCYSCSICKVVFNNTETLKQHVIGRTHKKMLDSKKE